MKFKDLYENACREVVESVASYWQGDDPTRQDDPYLNDFKRIIWETFCPDDCYPVIQSMFPWEASTASQQEIDNLVTWTARYKPYAHQFACWKALEQGKSICVTTGTGSGKTECFMLPVIHNAVPGAGVQAIFLYPLNALAEDQKTRFSKYIEESGKNLHFATYNGNTPENDMDDNYVVPLKHEINTREAIRNTPPEILVTNPTMLEYMLLRRNDQPILDASKNLCWIVIDETHTFKGAAAAELALLLRRVLLAAGVLPNQVQFITSSATTGSGNEADLKKFIAGISGKQADQIEIISGKRICPSNWCVSDHPFLSEARQREIRDILLRPESEYVPLNGLIPEGKTIAEKLGLLDDLCEYCHLPVKVHYFFRTLSEGLSVRLDKIHDGHFELFNQQQDNDEDYPLLELVRCPYCGTLLAKASGSVHDNNYQPMRNEDRVNIFDIDDNGDDDDGDDDSDDVTGIDHNITVPKILYFCPGNEYEVKAGHKFTYNLQNGTLNCSAGDECPHCHRSFLKGDRRGNDQTLPKKPIDLKTFRISAQYLSRILSPVLLDQTQMLQGQGLPHDGQQFISFIDSRQAAARITLKQSVYVERQWLLNRIFHLLSSQPDQPISWNDMCDQLERDPDFSLLLQQFADSPDDYDDQGRILDVVKHRYILTLMYEQLARRPRVANAAETLGLLWMRYPAIDNDVLALPDEVVLFNNLLRPEDRIDSEDWRILLHMYLDCTVRSRNAVFYQRNQQAQQNPDHPWHTISLETCRRFYSQQNIAREVEEPTFGNNRWTKLLCGLLGLTPSEMNEAQKILVGGVLHAMWTTLRERDLLVTGKTYCREGGWQSNDKIQLNLAQMELQLYRKAWLCPVTHRPLPYVFKGYSPYWDENHQLHKVEPLEGEVWIPYEFSCETVEDVQAWCQDHRRILNSVSRQTAKYYLSPKIYISAEHTAQIKRRLLDVYQQEFREHKINVLTCSTTMEMGVDLGDLELVEMNSVPPHPANYKQRAGRSGRNGQCRSAAVTLCGSDPVGLRTMQNPYLNLITRPFDIPKVDLNSPQLIKRHIAAFMIRTVGDGDNAPRLNDRIIDFFTPYRFIDAQEHQVFDDNMNAVGPTRGMCSDADETPYFTLRNRLVSDMGLPNPQALSSLVRGTALSGISVVDAAQITVSLLEHAYLELKDRFEYIKKEYTNTQYNNYRTRLNKTFVALLKTNLAQYLATHQVTPNAAMPVNVVEFSTKSDYDKSQDKPSYMLRQALSQYAPGSVVVLGNKCYVSGGLRWSNMYGQHTDFVSITQNNDGQIFLDGMPGSQRFKVNGQTSLTMIRPLTFVSDNNHPADRFIRDSPYYRTEVALVGTAPWPQVNNSRLIRVRSAAEDITSAILFYNVGMGYGFCVCPKSGCGRAEAEFCAATQNLADLPDSFMTGTRIAHQSVQSDRACSFNPRRDGRLLRNVVLGDTIQTDYTEIDIKVPASVSAWVPDGTKLRHTLGMLICNELATRTGINRGDIDYLITSFGSLCVYDQAKGGAGYSNRLCMDGLIYEVLDHIRNMINELTPDMLIDRYTHNNSDKIDLDAAKAWLDEEYRMRETLPVSIQKLSQQAQISFTLKSDILRALSDGKPVTLYAAADSVGQYDDFLSINRALWYKNCTPANTSLCLYGTAKAIDFPTYLILVRCQANVSLRQTQTVLTPGVWPIAAIGNNLYVTEDVATARLDGNWGGDACYRLPGMAAALQSTSLEPGNPNAGNSWKFVIPSGTEIPVRQLCDTVCGIKPECQNAIMSFMERHRRQSVRFVYQDEHLKSELGMLLTVQFVKRIVEILQPSDIQLCFEMEKYWDGRTNNARITDNLQDDRTRDGVLKKFCNSVFGQEIDLQIHSNPPRKLPHWRELKVEAGGECLVFYPNGGIPNGWFLGRNGRYVDAVDGTEGDINISSKDQTIMYDVEIKPV